MKTAVELYDEGFNCSQSVFVPFAKDFFQNEKIAFQLMSPFGGGISSTDNLCGAITGAIAAIGLKLGHSTVDETDKKTICSKATQQLIEDFKHKFGCINCTQLIGFNLSLPGQREEANKAKIFTLKCRKYVSYASQLVEETISKYS